tara:strand:+ start:517 stop:1296 length:780 start_codon:yes stop_codon:yes gene_type:complete
MTKAFVFDLDETIGHFEELSILDYTIKNHIGKEIKKSDFFKIMDLFPHIFRPNIFNIFKYLRDKKIATNGSKNKNKIKIMIYTNNTGCRMWANRIKSYIEKKINYKLFDRTICAWKYDNKILEKNRTGYDKRYFDLLKCGHLKKSDKIIFLDDTLFEKMIHPNVTYLHLIPYKYTYGNMINKYINQENSLLKDKKLIKSYSKKSICKNNNTELFNLKGKKIERHIKKFFEQSNNKTIKKYNSKKNKTRKKMKIKEYYKI